MNINELYPSKYLKASDLKGREANVEIEDVMIEKIGRDGDKRPVASLVGKNKRFVINKTNVRTIGDLHGPDTEDWIGKRIVIYPTITEYAGQETACLRVKPPKDYIKPSTAGKARNGPTEAGPEDEIPF